MKVRGLVDRARLEKAHYAHGEERPLGSFVGLMTAYTALVGVSSAGVAWSRRGLPERIGAGDLALLAVATHRLSRTIAKDPVTSPLRAPFTSFAGTSGEAELAEEVRGTGARKAIGELVTCPFCLAQWVGTGFVFSFTVAPRQTRLAASILSVVAAANSLQFAYARLEQST